MTEKVRTYPSKILLFGEYTILHNSWALAIPYRKRFGFWGNLDIVDERLLALHNYLLRNLTEDLLSIYKRNQALSDIQNGLAFLSNIPNGMGLGSSGSLTAAYFDRYFSLVSDNLIDIKEILSKIENFFHGNSSGIDPLVSYIDKGLVINEQLKSIDIHNNILSGLNLLDSGLPRLTQQLVVNYKNNIAPNHTSLITELSEYVGKAVDAIVSNRDFAEYLHNISRIQLSVMSPMIPIEIRDIWQAGIDTEWFSIKLCGAGGGGYFIVAIYDKKAERLLSDYNYVPIV